MKTEEQPTQSVVQFFISSSGVVVSSNAHEKKLHKDLPLYGEIDETRNQLALFHILKKITEEARTLYGVIDRITILLSSPWCASEIHTTHSVRTHEYVITQELLASGIRAEVARVEHTQNKKNTDMYVIEAESVQVRLNGYVTDQPVGQKARRSEIDVLISFLHKSLYEEITHIMNSHFHNTPITYHSMLYGYRSFLGQATTPVTTGTIVDYMAETTQVACMDDRGIYFTQSFPLGFHHVIRMTANLYGVDFQTARSLLHMYNDGTASDRDEKKIKKLLAQYKDEFMSALFRICADGRALRPEYALPMPLYMVRDNFWGKHIQPNENDRVCMQDLFRGPAESIHVHVVEIQRDYLYNYLY